MTSNGNLNHLLNNCGASCNVVRCWTWDVAEILKEKQHHGKYALLILNRPISQSQSFIVNFWNNATIRMTVDGGTLRWDNFLNNLSVEVRKSMKLPDIVTGDFDSITEDVLKSYKKKGCKVIHTPDQNHTDFTKALIELNTHCLQHKTQMDNVIAIGQTSGRLDQILSNIQTLYLVREQHLLTADTRLFLMSDDSLSWLLCPGDHVIMIPEETRKHKRAWCSLVPIGEACKSITTSGLKWDLDNQPLKFGALVSTSNTFDVSEKVKVKCSNTVLWSMKVPSVTS